MQKATNILAQSTNFRSFDPKKKNFNTAKMQKGGLDSALFSAPGYNSLGDPYDGPARLKLRSESMQLRKGMHGNEFRPGGKVISKPNRDFLNTPNGSPMMASANRTCGPRGFFTSPNKKGNGPGSLLQRDNYGHMVDEYDRKIDLAREERRMRRGLDIGKGFRNRVKGDRTFGKDLNEYGEDRLNIQPGKPKTSYDGIKHPNPWKYSNESKFAKKTINGHPGYIEEKEGTDNNEKLKKKKRDVIWYPTYQRKTEPSDSIVANFMNRPKYAFM